jgi:hypothetical protein
MAEWLEKLDFQLSSWKLNLANSDRGENASCREAQLETSSSAHMIDERWAKADDTRSTNPPHTWEDDSIGAVFHQPQGQFLRYAIALRNGTRLEIFPKAWTLAAKVVKARRKIGQVIVICGGLFELPVHFSELFDFVKGNFGG